MINGLLFMDGLRSMSTAAAVVAAARRREAELGQSLMSGFGEGQKAPNRQHDEDGNDQWSAFHEVTPIQVHS